MKRSTKKGFTIVELVIVIAIIAILAAVLIPTFASLIQKANESKDTQLVKNLNTALAADNKEHKTMTDALDAAVEFGYDVGKINASATNKEILWDSKNDVFCYYDTNTKTPEYIPETSLKNGAVAENETYKLWKIYTEAPTEQTFSIYWNSDKAFDKELTVGFDAGECTAITTLNYVRTGDKQEVVIRTNGATTLTVDAEKDTIYHYGEAGSVKVIKCDTASYHEFGKVVGNLEITKGRLELAASANVNTVLVSSAAEGDVKIDVASGATVGTIAPVTDKALADVNASTTIPAEAKQAEVITVNTDFAGGLGTERSPYLIANAEQFVNIGKLSEEMQKGTAHFFKLISDIDLRATSNFAKFGKNNLAAISGYFKGGVDGRKDDNSNYKLISNDALDYIFVNSKDSSTFSNIDYYLVNDLVSFCPGQSGKTTTVFDNFDMYTVDPSTSIQLLSNQGLYTEWVAGDVFNDGFSANNSVTIKNADVYVNIVGTGYNAVFFGGSPHFGGSATVIDSAYYGSYYGECVNLVLGNLSHRKEYSLVVTNVTNRGTLAATKGTPMIAGGSYTSDTKEDQLGVYTNVNLGINRWLYDAGLDINNGAEGLIIKEASSESTSYYVLTIRGGTRLVSSNSENSSYTFSIKIDKNQFTNKEYQTAFKDGKLVTVDQYKTLVDSNATFDSSKAVKVYGEENAEFWMVEKDGTLYYVFDFHDNGTKYFVTKPEGVITSSAVDVNNAMITAYDSEGLPIAQKNIDLK